MASPVQQGILKVAIAQQGQQGQDSMGEALQTHIMHHIKISKGVAFV